MSKIHDLEIFPPAMVGLHVAVSTVKCIPYQQTRFDARSFGH